MAARIVSAMLNQLGFTNQCIHGNVKQNKRTSIFESFMKSQQKGILVSTDVCARGVDFPNVDLIIQCDIPEQIPQYFHRVGRTARGGNSGTAILLLTEKEVPKALPVLKKHINETIDDDLLTEYPLPGDDLQPIQHQIVQIVQKDAELLKTANIIVTLYQKVFGNDFDRQGVQHSFGLA